MTKPLAVLGADIHYDISTLPLADAATRQMVAKANELNVPLIIAGDLHNTKSFHRAECQEAMLRTFEAARITPIILVGNHCRRNEKAPEHALHFLRSVADIVDRTVTWCHGALEATLIPYQHDANDFRRALSGAPPLVICHQGIDGADMGHYIQDKSKILKEDVANYRVISGHYHRRQDIKCGRPRTGAVGLFSYVGNPYTLTFGEANDPDKGYGILYDNGIIEFVPTNLRRHIVVSYQKGLPEGTVVVRPDDLIWVKATGTRSELAAIDKNELGLQLFGRTDYRLDKTALDDAQPVSQIDKLSDIDAMDSIIEGTDETAEQKAELKRLYRELFE